MKILGAEPLPGFRLHLTFADGIEGVADLSDMAGKGVFKAWLEPTFFEQVRVTDHGALTWPEDLDLCSDALYLKVTGKQPEELFPTFKRSLVHF